LIASGAADATIKIWEFASEKLNLLQTIKTSPKYFPLALSMSSLGKNEDALVLAVAGTRDTIQIFVSASSDAELQFSLQATLSGHEGWIRCLDFIRENDAPESDVLLASASQDKYVRVWRIHQGKTLPPLSAASVEQIGSLLPGSLPSNKAHRFMAGKEEFSVTFEALLFGHEDWIYSARWHRRPAGSPQLLSTSADNSLCIWEADPATGIWVTNARLGEISREKGATTATGSIGGFWTGLWSPDGNSVVTLGRTGSWRLWSHDPAQERWVQQLAISGHTRAVTGIAWSRSGSYLLSTSADQTTRMHAQWNSDGTWHEISRPQIHGYDLNCIDALSDVLFVSGADEKLMRVFSQPRAVAQLLHHITGKESDASGVNQLPDVANIPVLGLSNKAVDDNTDLDNIGAEGGTGESEDLNQAPSTSSISLNHPPFEESLSRSTLWPETEKLYGHGYEISCLAASHDGSLIASACRASSINHAVIRLFETRGWTEIRPPLTAHSLTATRLRFSPPDDRFLLSVGRDRQWAVFERGPSHDGDNVKNSPGPTYRLLQADPKGHSRMILDAAWAPVQEPWVFATAGRDKQAKIWLGTTTNDETKMVKFALAKSIASDHPVTAVDFLPRQPSTGKLVLALGTEVGKILVVVVHLDAALGAVNVISTTELDPG
jgi:elongator complex protein 2